MKRRLLAVAMAVTVLLTGCGEIKNPDTTGRYNLSDAGEAVISDVKWDSKVEVPATDNNRVFYEIFVGSFSDSDGDGIGDLRGIINRMDYLNDGDDKSGKSLGIEGIWLSPIFSSPSYHKYDVADYYAIDEKFGTMDDLKELVTLCHERNVKVILDMVINHTSSQNPWFKEFSSAHKNGDTKSPAYDFYTWSDAPINGRTFRKIPGSDDYYECNFSGDMPELNFDNELVKDEIMDVASYYINDIGVDGFRFDAAKYVYYGEHEKNVEFWNWYMDNIHEMKPDAYTVAEVWDSDALIYKYEEALNCFDFAMSQTDGRISETAKKGDVNRYTSYVENYINTVTGINDSAMIIPFIANHDMDRAAGYMQASTGFAFVAANLYILGPGSPFIYYGEEIGEKGSRGASNTDANRRLAMLWGDDDSVKDPEGADFKLSKQSNGTLADQIGNGDSIYNYYKRLIMLRKANPEIALGDYKALAFSDTKAGGFTATYEGSSVCVLHNTTMEEKTVDLSTVTELSFTKLTATIGVGNPEGTLEGTLVTIPAQSSVILR